MNKEEYLQKRYTCPNCKSKHIVYWEESILERKYKVKKDGEQSKRVFCTIEHEDGTGMYGLECMDCGKMINTINDDGGALWEV